MEIPLIISSANDRMDLRILKLVWVKKIVNPEKEFGKRFVNRLFSLDVIAETNLGEDLHLTKICIQPSMIGKTLVDLTQTVRLGA